MLSPIRRKSVRDYSRNFTCPRRPIESNKRLDAGLANLNGVRGYRCRLWARPIFLSNALWQKWVGPPHFGFLIGLARESPGFFRETGPGVRVLNPNASRISSMASPLYNIRLSPHRLKLWPPRRTLYERLSL